MNQTQNPYNQAQNSGWQNQPSGIQPTGFRCPYCQSPAGSYFVSKVSTQGWVVMLILLLFCFPLFWIGFLMKEETYYCRSCRMRLS